MSKDRVKTILDWPEPQKVKDVQSFGFWNFYWQFIHRYSDIVIPLTCLTQKSTPWDFNKRCRDSFEQLKEEFTHAPVLTQWVPNAKMILKMDASNYALVAILSVSLQMERSILLLFTPAPSTPPNLTTTLTTKNSWQFLKPSSIGDNI